MGCGESCIGVSVVASGVSASTSLIFSLSLSFFAFLSSENERKNSFNNKIKNSKSESE